MCEKVEEKVTYTGLGNILQSVSSNCFSVALFMIL